MVGTAPQPKSQTLLFGKVGARFPGDDPTDGPFVLLFTSVFCDFFQKVSSFESPQFGSGTFPFGWSPVHLAGVSLNIGRSSSASRVHLGPPFSSLMFPWSSAQVLLPCPGQFVVSMCAAFGTFPFPWLHFIGLYSPHMMSPPSNLHWFLHVFFICQMCPLPSCICSFYFSSICNFCLFSTGILLSQFFCNCHVCLFQICIFQLFLHVFKM